MIWSVNGTNYIKTGNSFKNAIVGQQINPGSPHSLAVR